MNKNTLRKVQLIQLEILIKFDEFCKLHNLKYQLFAGTLLGAIRHKGFIPWDDDVDIIMIREEYEKFLKLYNSKGYGDYFLQNFVNDKKFYRQFSRLRKNNTVLLQDGYKDIDMHHGIFIDIFPIDRVRETYKLEKNRYLLIEVLTRINTIRNRGVSKQSNTFKRVLGYPIKYTKYIFPKNRYDRLIEKLINKINQFDTGYVNHLTNGTNQIRYYKYLMTDYDVENSILWDFENYKFPIPLNYDKILRRLFGEYMKLPPKDMQKPHHRIIRVKLGGENHEKI